MVKAKKAPVAKAATKKTGAKPVKLTDIPVPSRELPTAKKTSVAKAATKKTAAKPSVKPSDKPVPEELPKEPPKKSTDDDDVSSPAEESWEPLGFTTLIDQYKETLANNTELQNKIFSDPSLYRIAKYVDMERFHQEGGDDRFEEITKTQTSNEYSLEIKTVYKNNRRFSPWLRIYSSITDQGDKKYCVKADRDFFRGDLIGVAPLPQDKGNPKFFMGLHWIRDLSQAVTVGAFAVDNVHVTNERLVYARKKIYRGDELVTTCELT